jgi:PleD family two-component response regulator
VVIVGNDQQDHVFLRKVMNKLVPQAIVESLYGDQETLNYFEAYNAIPSVIFLDRHLLAVNGNKIIPLIRGNEEMEQVPVIILSEDETQFSHSDSIRYGANEVYNKSYHSKNLDSIVSEIRDKWFVSILNQKNNS